MKENIDNDQIQEGGEYVDGQKEGKWIKMIGTVCRVENNYKDGKLDGEERSYVDGELDSITPYSNGKIHGLCIENIRLENWEKKYSYKNGKLDGKCTWLKDGKVVYERNYKDGKLDGKTMIDNDHGSYEGNYNNGKIVGEWIMYDKVNNVSESVEHKYINTLFQLNDNNDGTLPF